MERFEEQSSTFHSPEELRLIAKYINVAVIGICESELDASVFE